MIIAGRAMVMRCAVFAAPPADDDPLTRAVAHRLGRDAFTAENRGSGGRRCAAARLSEGSPGCCSHGKNPSFPPQSLAPFHQRNGGIFDRDRQPAVRERVKLGLRLFKRLR